METKKMQKLAIAFFAGVFFLISLFILGGNFFKQFLPDKVSGSDLKQELFIYGENYYGRGGLFSFTSKEAPTIGLGAYKLSGEATIDIYRVSAGDILNGLVYDKEGKQVARAMDLGKFENVASFSQYVSSGYDENQENRVTLPLEGQGTWLVNASLNGIQAKAFIVRSDIGALVKEGDNKMIFWTQDLSNKKSLSEVNIKVYNLQDSVTKRYEVISNKEGIVETGLSSKDDLAIIKKGGDVAVIPLNLRDLNNAVSYKYFVEKSIAEKIFTFTDRPLYTPGDKVYFKSIIREDDDARYSIKKGTVEVEVFKGWGTEKEIISTNRYEISSEGTISGEFDLSKDLKNGSYTLGIKRNEADKSSSTPYAGFYSDYLSQVSFNVEYYQKPEYGIDVTVADDDIISGDELSFSVEGSYFSGQPVSNQEVSYTVYSSDFYEYSYLQSFSNYSLSDDYRYGYRYGKTVTNGTALLNDKGQAEIKVDSTIPKGKKRSSQIYSIEVELKDASGNESFERKNVLVRAGEFSIYRDNKSYFYGAKVGQEISLPIILSPTPTSREVTGDIERNWWDRVRVDSSEKYKYNKGQETFPSVSARTDSEGKAVLRFTPEREGSYTMSVSGTDDRGNTVTKDFYFWVSDSRGHYSGGGKNQGLTVKASQEEYSPTGEATFTIYSEIPDRDVFFSLERGYVDRYQIIHLRGNEGVVKVPLKENDIPNMFAYVGSFADSKIEEATEGIDVSAESKRMKIILTPDKAKYGPGETATFSIKATDYRNRPVSAEIAVWLVDKALFELMTSSTGDVFNNFWRKRYDDTQNSNSLISIFGNMAEKGGGGDSAREIFKDTAYWNPEVHTDKNGYAQISFKLPDNLTTWVLSGVGSTRDTMVGQTTNEIVVTKDVIIRPVLPNILRTTDEVIISALAQNFTGQAEEFSAKLEFDAGDVENETQAIELLPGESKQIFWKVHPNKENETAQMKFSLVGRDAKNSDIIVKNIPVRKAGFWDTKVQVGTDKTSYDINLFSDTDQEKATFSLSLSSTMLGALPSSMKYLLGYPYGCVEQTTSRFVPAVIAKENPVLLHDSIGEKDLDALMKAGVDRLYKLQSPDGGWGWWGNSSDYFISTYVAEYLLRAKRAGAVVSDEMLDKAKGYFQKDVEDKGYTAGQLREINIIRDYGKSLFGEKVLVEDFSGYIAPDILSLAVISNIRNGFNDPSRNGRDKLISLAKKEGEEKIYWEGGNIERFGSINASTGLALQAFIAAGGDRETMLKAVHFLVDKKETNYWSNTFATVQVIHALVDFAKIEKEVFPNFQYDVKLDGEKIASGTFNDKNWEDEIIIDAKKIKNNSAVLSIEKNSENHVYALLLQKEFRLSDNASRANNGIGITRSYVNEKGSNYSIGVGDIVDVNLVISGDFSDKNYIVIEDQLPAGMVPINPVFKNSQYNYPDISFGGWLKEIDENKIVFASNYYSNNETVSYKARVVSEGEFKAPPVTAALMYSPEVNGHSDMQQVRIAKKSEKLFDYANPGALLSGKKISTAWMFIENNMAAFVLIVASTILLLATTGFVAYKKIRKKITETHEDKNIST